MRSLRFTRKIPVGYRRLSLAVVAEQLLWDRPTAALIRALLKLLLKTYPGERIHAVKIIRSH